MNNLKTFDISISTIILRFYLMMAVVIVAGFSGYWLVALLAFPIFLSIMMGISFRGKGIKETSSIKKMNITTGGKYPEVA